MAALLEGIGSGAVSNPVRDVGLAEVVLVIGANPTVNHPVAATWIKNAVKKGMKLAADALESAEADIEFTSGAYRIKGTDRAIGITALAQKYPGKIDLELIDFLVALNDPFGQLRIPPLDRGDRFVLIKGKPEYEFDPDLFAAEDIIVPRSRTFIPSP